MTMPNRNGLAQERARRLKTSPRAQGTSQEAQEQAEPGGSKNESNRQVKNDSQEQGLRESDRVAVLLENTYFHLRSYLYIY